MIKLYASLFAASFAVTVLLVPLVIRLARRVGFLDLPGPRKIHTQPVPYGGGLAVAAAVLGTTFAATRIHGSDLGGVPVSFDLFPGIPGAHPRHLVPGEFSDPQAALIAADGYAKSTIDRGEVWG